MQATLLELEKWPDAPMLIVTDLNAEVSDIEILELAITQGTWYDVGSMAHVWGGTAECPTCLGTNASRATRRDYIFANSAALQYWMCETQSFSLLQYRYHP